MSKRFTDTDKWRDSWFQALSPSHKIAMLYVFDNCDASGVFDPNLQLADFCIGTPIDWKEFRVAAGNRLAVLSNGKWHLTRFVDFQYGVLSPDCKPHLNVIRLLQGHGIQRVSKGYPKGQGKEKDKEKEQEEETTSELVESIYSVYPRKEAPQDAKRAIRKAIDSFPLLKETLLAKVQAYADAVKLWSQDERKFIPHPATWFNRGSYDEDPSIWRRGKFTEDLSRPDVAKILKYTI